MKLTRRRGNILKIDCIDAYTGSPVLDIKPYTGHPKDLIKDYHTPQWTKNKKSRHDKS